MNGEQLTPPPADLTEREMLDFVNMLYLFANEGIKDRIPS